MTQLVIGAALGFIVAQGVLYGLRHTVGWIGRDDVRTRIRALAPSPGPALIGGFIKYAAPLGASAALITLGVWAVSDYLAAKSAGTTAAANALDASTAVPASSPPGSAEEVAALTPAPKVNPPAAAAAAAADDSADPYADADFKVRHRLHRPGSAMSLKDTLVQRSEAKARDELLLETQQHVNRSQYDCEAADHADRYLKAGLDVWGFAAWQTKHFPLEGYKGATLPQCKGIREVIDTGRLDERSAVAQRNHV